MKYKPEDYIGSGFYSNADDEVLNPKEKLVKSRKAHKCVACTKEIEKGQHAVSETGFVDGKPVSCHTCLPCIEAWLEESGQVESDDCESEVGQIES